MNGKMGKVDKYNLNDVKSALSCIRRKEMSKNHASRFFKIPLETLEKLLATDKVKNEEPEQKLELKSVFTKELEQKLIDYAVNMAIQICAAKSEEERKILAYDTLNLKFFKAPPGVKMLKVCVKRNIDKSPFYVFKVTPYLCSHFVSSKTIDAAKNLSLVEGKNVRSNFSQNIHTEPMANLASTSRLGNMDSEFFEEVPSHLQCHGGNSNVLEEELMEDESQIKEEKSIQEELFHREKLISDEIPIESIEPIESKIKVEFREPILKEELNIEDWQNFEMSEQMFGHFVKQNVQDEKIIPFENITIKEEVKAQSEMILDDSDYLKIDKLIKKEKIDENSEEERFNHKWNKDNQLIYPLAQKRRDSRREIY